MWLAFIRLSKCVAVYQLALSGIKIILAILHIDCFICYTYNNINRTPRTSQRCAPGETFFYTEIFYEWSKNTPILRGTNKAVHTWAVVHFHVKSSAHPLVPFVPSSCSSSKISYPTSFIISMLKQNSQKEVEKIRWERQLDII